MKKKKGFFYYSRLILEFFVLSVLLLCFIVPRYALNHPSVKKKIERSINSRTGDMKAAFGDLHFSSLADIRLSDVSLELFDEKKKSPSKIAFCEKLSFLLPPESLIFPGFPPEKKCLLSAFVSCRNAYISFRDLRIRQLSLDLKVSADQRFFKTRDLFRLPFLSRFEISRLDKGSAAFSRVKGLFSNTSGDSIEGKGTFLWNDSPVIFVASMTPEAADAWLQAEDFRAENLSLERVKVQGLFRANVHVRIKEKKIESMLGTLLSREKGMIRYVDLYDIADGMPEEQKKNTYYVLDSLKNYRYARASISLEWKDDVFIIDCDMKGEKDGDDRHIIIPLHNLPVFLQ